MLFFALIGLATVVKGWHHNAAAGYVQKTFALCHATTFDEVLLS